MNDALATTAVAYALGLAAWAGVTAARGGGIAREQAAAALVLEVALAGQAAAAAVAWTLGSGPGEPGAAAGYLIASVAILPLTVRYGRGGDGSRWDALVLLVGAVAVAAVVLRLRATWAPA